MSYFIIVRGPLGCGKTTIAKRLAQDLRAEHISIDDILDEHGLDQADPEIGGISAANFIKANEIVLPGVKDALKNGKVVVFDGCFYHKEAIDHLIDNLPYPHYVFTLKAPVEMCITRDKGRSKTYGEDAARVVHMFVSKFDYGINIDASGTFENTVEAIRSHLPNPTQPPLTLRGGD